MVKAKKHGGAAYWKHGLVHYAAIVVVTMFADPALLARIRFQAICVALIGTHLLIDFCKERLTAAAKIRDNALTFLADQAAHIATIVAAALIVTIDLGITRSKACCPGVVLFPFTRGVASSTG
jgi:hypothetical protein